MKRKLEKSMKGIRRLLVQANQSYMKESAVSCKGVSEKLFDSVAFENRGLVCELLGMAPQKGKSMVHKIGGSFIKHYAVLVGGRDEGVVLDPCFGKEIPFQRYPEEAFQNPSDVIVLSVVYQARVVRKDKKILGYSISECLVDLFNR